MVPMPLACSLRASSAGMKRGLFSGLLGKLWKTSGTISYPLQRNRSWRENVDNARLSRGSLAALQPARPKRLPAAHTGARLLSSVALIAPSVPIPAEYQTSLRLGVLASGSGSNFEAVVAACRRGDLRAEVVSLVVNNPDCGATVRAGRLGVPCTVINHRHFVSCEALDEALIAHFTPLAVDLLVMAGWMRIVSPLLCRSFRDRMVNIHPALLPAFRGTRAIERALAAGVTITGWTAHLEEEEVDGGRILCQAAVVVQPDDTPASLAPRIHAVEHRILPSAIALAGQLLTRAEA